LRPVLAAIAALAALAAPAAAQDTRPNVVVLMTDDQTHDTLRSMTAVNRLLGDHGTTFDRTVASFPLCCPSRSTYLTGQYAHNHGVIHNAGPFGGFRVFDHPNALPVWLRDSGYRTMHVGRYLNGYGETSGIPPGWDDWHAAIDPSTFNYASWRMNDDGRISAYPLPGRPPYQTDEYAQRAVELIDGAAPEARPFFLEVWFAAPHSGRPRDPDDPTGIPTPSPAPRHRDAFAGAALERPPSFDEANVRDKPQIVADRTRLTQEQIAGIDENRRQELESLMAVDDAVASIVGALERLGELQNTLVVFVSDNGYMHGEHRWPTEKVLPYEPSSRVPLVLRGPGVPAGRVDRRLVANLDVPATILDATGVTSGRVQDGQSLLDMLADPSREWGRDILLENGQGANGVPAYRALRTPDMLYVEHLTTGERELYDMARDPFQLTSRDSSDRYAAARRDLARRLRLLARCRGAGCRKRPWLKLLVHAPTRPVAGGRRCFGGDLRVRVGGRDGPRVARADVLVGRRRVARVRAPGHRVAVPSRRLAPGRERLLRAQVRLRDGQRYTVDRRVIACR
jgi:N-acetylglucosamine-6-sulfatase